MTATFADSTGGAARQAPGLAGLAAEAGAVVDAFPGSHSGNWVSGAAVAGAPAARTVTRHQWVTFRSFMNPPTPSADQQ
ncbi:hypothetical protein GCM10009828_010080 [Actinoplanes couchii]|uniref:Uncharacterized protein n=1 Tax=Actinoplanes couchii TaxID=403638 RepID=A0ABQ3XIX8_9ACTN|nr:hypothetical protein Aco03nite_068530 [Actinoplanes couchii]